MSGEFDTALLAGTCLLERSNGERLLLPAERWRREPEDADELLISRCGGPTLDVGCGPGRLAGALGRHGVTTLGIDSSAVAVRLAIARGAVALRRDVFNRLPGEGRWRHVLLADGNIGIGGDPVRLLARVAQLLAPHGSALVELEPPGCGLRQDRVRLDGASGRWFRWAWLGVDAVGATAAEAGFRVRWTANHGRRWFVELIRAGQTS